MKIIRKARLRFTEGNSDKVYEVDLCALPGSEDERFVVNFRYGRFGRSLRDGSKTPSPVSREKANKVFDSLVVSKINKGYQDMLAAGGNGSEAAEPAGEKRAASGPVLAIANTIMQYLDRPPKHWPLSRIIWRAGELALNQAADKIASKVGSDNKPVDYSVAWALGRCGNTSHLPAIEKLQCSRDASIKRMADEAWLQLADSHQCARVFAELKKQLPDEMRRCIENNNDQELSERLAARLLNSHSDNLLLLENLYTLAREYACCHAAIVHNLRNGHFSDENYFKAYRHIYKLSEFRLDAAVYGLITLRIETSKRGYWGKPFRENTKNYLRKRSWRTLRKLGEADNGQYVEMASAVLLTVSDDHAQAPQTIVRSEWNWESRQTEVVSQKHFDKYPSMLALNQILYRNSQQFEATASRLAWVRISDTVDAGRAEAFPELWDQQPEALLHLLINSRCEPVHLFAGKALRANSEFCQQISAATIVQLLQSNYDCTAALALELAITIYDEKQPDSPLVAACFNAAYSPAREQALVWINQNPKILKQDLPLFAAALCSSHQDIRDAVAALIGKVLLSGSEKQALIAASIDLLGERVSQHDGDYCKAVISLLVEHFDDEVERLSLDNIAGLIRNENVKIQLLGAQLLVNNRVDIRDIASDLLAQLNQADDDDIQAAAVTLLGKYSDSELFQKQALLLSYCVAERASVRQAVQAIIGRLSQRNSAFSAQLLQELIPHFFKTEPFEGLHEDLLSLTKTQLQGALASMDTGLRWRLLNAQSKAAQALGALSLEHARADEYSVKQWAKLAGNANHSVREWVMMAYQHNIRLVKAEAADALRILNCKWDDSRAFGINFFRDHFQQSEWTASLIIGICDNTQDDVQRFGRELITTFFEEGDGPEYLVKLSQHPSRNVQLFTTNYLSSYAADNMQHLQQLRRYFITVLSNVYKGRVAKDRVILFLLKEALKHREAAELVADIFDRQSMTISIMDKASYIEGMRDIQQRYPDIKMPIQVKALPIKAKKQEIIHAV